MTKSSVQSLGLVKADPNIEDALPAVICTAIWSCVMESF